jgi:hypothetical protein
MTLPTFHDDLNSGGWMDHEDIARETLAAPLGVELYTGERIIDYADRSEADWRECHLDHLLWNIERRAWARQYMADREAFYRRDPETGYSEAELRAEARSIRDEERRMREDHERDIVRGLGGQWW